MGSYTNFEQALADWLAETLAPLTERLFADRLINDVLGTWREAAD